LPIANGGTNSNATPTQGGVGYGTGTAHAYSAAGSSGQILQSNGTSAPSWISTLGVANGGTGLNTATTNGVIYGNGTSAFGVTSAGLTGQYLVGNTGSAPTWANISGTLVTSFSAGTTGFTPSTATSGAVTLAGTLATTNGGTGLTSFTSGGALYAISTSALTTGTLPIASGGTGITSFGTGVQTALGQNVTGSGGIVLATSPTLTTPNLGTPSAINLTNATNVPMSQASGTLGTGNGGTGLTGFTAANNAIYSTSSSALTAGTLPVLAGGTGTTTSTGTGSVVLSASPTLTGTLSAAAISASGNIATSGGTVSDSLSNVRTVPIESKSTAYTLTSTDAGQAISITTGGITVPSGVFSAGQNVTIYNNSSSNQTITQGSGVTMYLVGTSTTGNRTLAQYGLATLLCVASNTFVITGGGLT